MCPRPEFEGSTRRESDQRWRLCCWIEVWLCSHLEQLNAEELQDQHISTQCLSSMTGNRRIRGSLGSPEPGDWLGFVFVSVACLACMRVGEAELGVRGRCRVFLLTLALALGSSTPVRCLFAKVRTCCACWFQGKMASNLPSDALIVSVRCGLHHESP